MITLQDVSHRYSVDHVPGKWILHDVSLVIPGNTSIGLIGVKGVGKSTLLRLISGAERPTQGRIESNVRVATPMQYFRSLQPLLSGRQNAKFICRINGYADDMQKRLAEIERLSGLHEKFDKPVNAYTSPMKLSLSFALSMAFDFDLYISDGFNFAGEGAYKERSVADAALEKLSGQAGLIMAAKGVKYEAALKRYCKAGILLQDGKALWFDSFADAVKASNSSRLSQLSNRIAADPDGSILDAVPSTPT